MTWNDQHRRGDVLRAVETAADQRRDGVLPMQVPGVAETFADEADLVGALLLRWHARLSANIERALADQPMDLASAVSSAWTATAEQLVGVRLVVDRLAEGPDSGPTRVVLRARQLERGRLAVAAGLASHAGPLAEEAGRRLEEQVRENLHLDAAPRPQSSTAAPADPAAEVESEPESDRATSFVDRIRAALVA